MLETLIIPDIENPLLRQSIESRITFANDPDREFAAARYFKDLPEVNKMNYFLNRETSSGHSHFQSGSDGDFFVKLEDSQYEYEMGKMLTLAARLVLTNGKLDLLEDPLSKSIISETMSMGSTLSTLHGDLYNPDQTALNIAKLAEEANQCLSESRNPHVAFALSMSAASDDVIPDYDSPLDHERYHLQALKSNASHSIYSSLDKEDKIRYFNLFLDHINKQDSPLGKSLHKVFGYLFSVMDDLDFNPNLIRQFNEVISEKRGNSSVMSIYHECIRRYGSTYGNMKRRPLYDVLEDKQMQFFDYWMTYASDKK